MAVRKKAVKKKGKWMQKARASMKSRGTVGSFRAWCKSKGMLGSDGKVTSRCIAAGKKAKSAAIRKKANFAANAGKSRRK